jgi:2',3'-cyclic-nucleotide 2'-phosphodiesterase (5'-nucleotidase family)
MIYLVFSLVPWYARLGLSSVGRCAVSSSFRCCSIVAAWIVAFILGVHALAGVDARSTVVCLTSDTEGHVGPCQACPGHPGLGGLDRRATLVDRIRREEPSMVLLDAGNALFGAESVESRGRLLVVACDAMRYDAVNLSYRDFRLGKAATLSLIKEAKFRFLSANLYDTVSEDLLARPYVVKPVRGRRVALIGVTGAPAGLGFLPHLKEQLDGVRIQPPSEALATWLPKARAESDRVILLYYGSATGVEKICERFANQIDLILVGGSRPEELPSGTKPPIVGTSQHGRELARVQLTETTTGLKIETTQIPIEATLPEDASMKRLLEEFTTGREDRSRHPDH